MTPAEDEQVSRLWDTMPGNTCWNQAFLRWMANDCPDCGGVGRGGPNTTDGGAHDDCCRCGGEGQLSPR